MIIYRSHLTGPPAANCAAAVSIASGAAGAPGDYGDSYLYALMDDKVGHVPMQQAADRRPSIPVADDEMGQGLSPPATPVTQQAERSHPEIPVGEKEMDQLSPPCTPITQSLVWPCVGNLIGKLLAGSLTSGSQAAQRPETRCMRSASETRCMLPVTARRRRGDAAGDGSTTERRCGRWRLGDGEELRPAGDDERAVSVQHEEADGRLALWRGVAMAKLHRAWPLMPPS